MPTVPVGNNQEVSRALSELIEDTRFLLEGGLQPDRTTLTTTVDDLAASNTIVLDDDVPGLDHGSILEIGTEAMYVRSYDANTTTATVIRGDQGSTRADHTAGDSVRINPPFLGHHIARALREEGYSLDGTGLVDHIVVEFTYDSACAMYNVPVDGTRTLLGVWDAQFDGRNVGDAWRPLSVELVSSMDTDDFASGYALRPLRPATHGRLVRVVLTQQLYPWNNDAALDEDDHGVTPTIANILAYGAAARLMFAKEGRRLSVDTSHGSRRAEEVQGGAISFFARQLMQRRDDLVGQALSAQYAQFPPRIK